MIIRDDALLDFISESNKIEGLYPKPTAQLCAYIDFLTLNTVYRGDVQRFVAAIEPAARLRDQPGLDVRVGNYFPPPGGPGISLQLDAVLEMMQQRRRTPFSLHVAYESIHPFTDGNGRSGRVLWLWQMQKRGYDGRRGFLHEFYYQTLDAQRSR
jgi:hypothetical protein